MNENVQGNQEIMITDRKNARITGVVDVIAFDDKEVLLDTNKGRLSVKGHELHVEGIQLEQGHVTIRGEFLSFIYLSDERKKEKTLLHRLLG